MPGDEHPPLGIVTATDYATRPRSSGRAHHAAVAAQSLSGFSKDELDPQLLGDYAFVRAGDLASLAFCNNWTNTPDDGCGYAMRLDGTNLTIVPDPFAGRVIEISIEAHEIPNQRFASAHDARTVLATAPVVTLKGTVKGSAV